MGKIKYINQKPIEYYSRRYNKTVYVPLGYPSDGATRARDLKNSKGWWVHDVMTDTGQWGDGSRCTNWQASMVLSDILQEEGRWFRKVTWKWATFLFGGKEARKNGMFKLGNK